MSDAAEPFRFLSGVNAASAGFVVSELARGDAPLSVVVAANLGRAEVLAEDAAFFAANFSGGGFTVCGLPRMTDESVGEASFENECDLLAALATLKNARPGERVLLACTPEAFRRPVPAPDAFAARELTLRVGEKFSMDALREKLSSEFNYDNEALCEAPGQFSVRGGLIDVYPLNASAPVRVDFFGDEVEAIREFDPTTQRTLRRLESVAVASGALASADESPRAGTPADYFPAGTRLIFAEAEAFAGSPPEELLRAARERGFGVAGFSAFDEVPAWLADAFPRAAAETLETQDLEELAYGEFSASALGVERLAEAEELRRRVLLFLDGWAKAGERVCLVCESEGAEERLREILDEERGAGTVSKRFSPEIFRGNVSAGFRLARGQGSGGVPDASPRETLVVATEREIFGRHRRRVAQVRRRLLPNKAQVEQLLDFNELADGDYLVHLQHGVCVFRGIRAFERAGGAKEEMLALEFENKVTLCVPFREAHLISRYVGLRKALPKLGKIGGNAWEKTRRAAEKATLDFAAELLDVQATRTTRPGFAALPDDELPWMREFEKAFPFAETPDQARAIAETKKDMERPSPMDRLICGDVGFGKTEVAIRAAFKAVLSGRQVAVLAPTTVLAQQHFNTFRDRFAHYPVSVEMLSRFRSPKQQREIRGQLERGELDVVVGTHALLASSVKFKKLGLLVIDEEHRFGVKQKEKIKRLRTDVDVLAMSATPIPRTLYLALMGARDLSVIETAPRERLPIRTVVRTYDAKLVKDAILHELGRGGQVFYLHNRVDTICQVAELLARLVPEAKIAVGHGQMDERDLERVMTDFVAGTFDVLVCTTIIETGLDIPNCNTIIIEAADRFGLGQLYQLRGRVGRFNRQAYAYLLLHRHRSVVDAARKRLAAMRQFNQLGAGFRIAMRDLELRGAGNILGLRQSGHVAGVGFELYCRLLRQSVAALKGEKPVRIFRAEINLDFVHYAQVPESGAKDARTDYQILKDAQNEKYRGAEIVATVPADYVADARVRIDVFRRLALAGTPEEVREVAEAMEDRFGKLPPPARAFCEIAELRCLAEERGVVDLTTEAGVVKARRRNGEYLRVGVNFPRLESLDPLKRLRELRALMKRL
ncbi:MAG: transcription-repair coupling factor [Candidatus Spyradosoma sp.]